MSYKPKKFDYISWSEGTGDDKKTRYGKITGVAGTTLTVKPYEELDTDTLTKGVFDSASLAEVKKSTWARMKMRAKPNAIELAENVVGSSLYHALVQKNGLFGAENICFLLADATHEFLTKGLAESMMDMFGPSALEKDGSDFFQMTDISDAARKLPFIVGFQQVYQKLFFKKHLSHQVMSNTLGGFGVLYASNLADRMWYSDTSKTPNYTYP